MSWMQAGLGVQSWYNPDTGQTVYSDPTPASVAAPTGYQGLSIADQDRWALSGGNPNSEDQTWYNPTNGGISFVGDPHTKEYYRAKWVPDHGTLADMVAPSLIYGLMSGGLQALGGSLLGGITEGLSGGIPSVESAPAGLTDAQLSSLAGNGMGAFAPTVEGALAAETAAAGGFGGLSEAFGASPSESFYPQPAEVQNIGGDAFGSPSRPVIDYGGLPVDQAAFDVASTTAELTPLEQAGRWYEDAKEAKRVKGLYDQSKGIYNRVNAKDPEPRANPSPHSGDLQMSQDLANYAQNGMQSPAPRAPLWALRSMQGNNQGAFGNQSRGSGLA